MKTSLERARWWPFVVFGLIGLALARESYLGTFNRVDGLFVDWLCANTFGHHRFEVRTDESLLTLVEIDDSTVEHGWPLSPLDYAVFFRAVAPAEPGVIAVEEVLRWEAGGDFTGALESYVMRSPQVLLAWELAPPDQPGFAFEAKPVLRSVQGNTAAVPEFDGARLGPMESLGYVAAQGFATLDAEPRTPVRAVPMLFRAGRDLFPSFTLRAAMQWLKVSSDDVVVKLGSSINLGGARSIPIDQAGMMLIRPRSKSKHPRLGLDELLVAAERRETSRHPRFAFGGMKGQIVLLGRTDRESRTYLGPNGRPASRAELFASALEAIQRNSFMVRVPLLFDIGIAAAAAGLLALMKRMRRWRSIVAAGLFVVGYIFLALVLYDRMLFWPPFTLVIVLVAVACAYRLWLPGRIQKPVRGRQVDSLLSDRTVKRFKPEVAEEVESAPAEADGDPPPDDKPS